MFTFHQISPADWNLTDKIKTVLKPFFLTTKAAEGDTVSIGEVIPLLKKLKHEVDNVDGRGIGTLKSEVLAQMEKYVLHTYIGFCPFLAFTNS